MGCWATGKLCSPQEHTSNKNFGHHPNLSPGHFCWNYTKSGQYTIKSRYWISRNLLEEDEETKILDPSITKFQAFAWKIKEPKKICHLIWTLITT